MRRRARVPARGDGVGDGVGGDEERLERAAEQRGERVRGAPPPQRVPVYPARREPGEMLRTSSNTMLVKRSESSSVKTISSTGARARGAGAGTSAGPPPSPRAWWCRA